ncbi:hypothetical protein [Mangrovihabitans endophyticus]|uniref:Methyltransferase domain-containing protein n=1 Tax=Mangrovihabitans endophyticus TaxID=1751298 RepID=A0A8J3C1V8_9ACTN|nr:hypothetical protein [Mangrovihabitans endophyticus]GGK98096.1 hypothetical protein GCM10012284_35430 [Mangrovihabitans endophyticus]
MTTEVALIGGEMPAWSDRQHPQRPPAGSAALVPLVDAVARQLPDGGEALVAGPHADVLLDVLAAHAPTTCLVRAEADAATVAARGVRVLCGTLPKLQETGRYDLVVALDGMGRLCSVEGPQYDWSESLRALHRTLRPGGRLLIAVENDLGVHRLVDLGTPTSPQGDEQWLPIGEYDETKPGSPDRLGAHLSAEGWSLAWLGAAWARPGQPALIAEPEALRAGPAAALAATAARAAGTAYAGHPVLSDPRRLAAAAVRAGLGVEFAAAWLVVAHRGDPSAHPPSATRPPVPPVLLADGPVLALTRDERGTWHRSVLDRGTPTAGRDPARLDGPLPNGRLLEELLIAAAVRYDARAVRALLSRWAAWVGTLPDAARAYATVDNVLLDGDTPALLDPSWRSPEPVATSSAVAAAMRRFADTLMAGGYAHPWPAVTDVETLTAVLTGAAGMRCDRPVPEPQGPLKPVSQRETEEQIRSLRQQLADTRDQLLWHERQLTKREQELARARRTIAMFDGSLGYRAAKLGAAALRTTRKAWRRSRR